MSVDIKELKQSLNIVEVVGNHISLKKRGPHHFGLCPFHADDKESLCVTESKGIFKCFACGESGDAIDFVQKLGNSLPDAIKMLSNNDVQAGNVVFNQVKSVEKPKFNPVYPFPNVGDARHPIHGAPSTVWSYHDESGNVLQHVCRFDFNDGTKQVLPLIYGNDGGQNRWKWIALESPRPIFNRHLINANPYATIVIVEGEKTATHGQNNVLASQFVFTCWIGGAHGIKNADWTPIHGRNVVVIPDNDTEQKYNETHIKAGQIKPWFEQPGNHAMLEIGKLISNDVEMLKWVQVPRFLPHKWDVADQEWQPNELNDFIKRNLKDFPVVHDELPVETTVANFDIPKNPEPPKRETDNVTVFENEFFRHLGYDKDESGKIAYYFFSFDAKTVVRLTPSSMSKSNLMMLAPVNWWESKFPGSKTSVNIDAAQQYLIGTSHNVGTFSEKIIRGRGAWIDNKQFVIHTGDSLIIDGKSVHLKSHRSRYVYEISEPLKYGVENPLDKTESAKIISSLKWLNWERDVNAYLLAGWCVISPFGGVLPWRPHVWITGAAGTGKSWTMENVGKRLIGETGIVMQGKTTEAYIRGKLQNDALPVIFDETDVDSHNDKERVQSVLALVRSSSYGNGGVVGKGTQNGGSKEYNIRSCFLFGSISVQLNQQSDRTRFSILTLNSFEGKRTEDDFIRFQQTWNDLVDDDFVKRLQARTLKMLPVILKNSKTFSDAVSSTIGMKRIGDQVGVLLAAAYSLTSDSEITLQKAVEFVKERDWNEEKTLEQTKDESMLFGKIMSHIVMIDTIYGHKERAVGELLSIAHTDSDDPLVTKEAAEVRLRRMGVILKSDCFIISNTSPEIQKIVRETAWSKNHNKILERIPGAERVEPRVFFPGHSSRGVSLPISLITDK